MSGYQLIAQEAGRLAKLLPSSVAEGIAARLEGDNDLDWGTLRCRAVQAVPSPHHRSAVVAFLDRWRSEAGAIPPQAVAAALHTAVFAEKERREGQSVELVWTGPNVGVVPLRRTEQAVLQIIDSARVRLLVVSYAVYAIPHIQEAVGRAARRGVAITIVVETPDRLDVANEYSTLRALGEDVASFSNIYCWPKEQRKTEDSGKLGLLHVKCVVGDGNQLFVSSANLTKYAFTLNMELGALITGGDPPRQIEAIFDSLIQRGILARC